MRVKPCVQESMHACEAMCDANELNIYISAQWKYNASL
jgi:hypothetical protein